VSRRSIATASLYGGVIFTVLATVALVPRWLGSPFLPRWIGLGLTLCALAAAGLPLLIRQGLQVRQARILATLLLFVCLAGSFSLRFLFLPPLLLMAVSAALSRNVAGESV
jgi:hypothetical protein